MSAPVALITGASRGIGRQLALEMSKRGYAIGAFDVTEEGLRLLAEQIPNVAWEIADVVNGEELRDKVRILESKLGPTDVLIANAGIGRDTGALKYDAPLVQRIIEVNLIGVSNSIGSVLPGMIERRSGHLVAMSSIASYRGFPRMAAYSASKAGVNALMESLQIELAPLGIHTTTICPSWIRTAMTAELHDKLPDILELEVGVRHIMEAIRNKRRFVIFPRKTLWKLRFLSWFPRSTQEAFLRKMSSEIAPKK